jgi:hypothetical protein
LSIAAAAAAAVTLLPAQALAESPAQRCGPDNWFAIEYVARYEGATGSADRTYVRRVPSRGGCASSWAQGEGLLSTAAIVAQCREGIEPRLGPYPITVQLAERHVLTQRADCIRVMTAVSSGELDPGRAPLFPGGA